MKCRCNRIGEHCPQCGSISKHPLVQRTAAAIGILRIEIRYYRCRKCGTEYGWFQSKFYDQECFAPADVRLVAVRKNVEEIVKSLNEAIQTIQSYGGKVEFPNGIIEEPINPEQQSNLPKASEEIGDIGQNSKEGISEGAKELGFTTDAEGKLVAPFSIDDFLRKKKERSNESDNQDKS